MTLRLSRSRPRPEVWKVLADQFLDNAVWAPGVISSRPNPATPDGVNGSRYGGRLSEIDGLGTADVRLVAYDSAARMLSYTLEAENVPPFIERLQNTWTITPDRDGSCTVDTQLAVTIADSMAENEKANMAVESMFAQTAAAARSLKTYLESDGYGEKDDR